MTKDEVLKLALEALEDLGMKHFENTGEVLYKDTFTAIKEVLAQPEQEPVAFVKGCNKGQWEIFPAKAYQIFEREQPLYTTPPQPWEKFCDSNCVWTDHHPDCKLAEQEPVACDGDFPEGFDASLGVPAQALRVANAIMCDVIGKREWDVPCTAQHVLSFAKKYTTPPQRTWVGLTDEEREEIALEVPMDAVLITEAKLKAKNT